LLCSGHANHGTLRYPQHRSIASAPPLAGAQNLGATPVLRGVGVEITFERSY